MCVARHVQKYTDFLNDYYDYVKPHRKTQANNMFAVLFIQQTSIRYNTLVILLYFVLVVVNTHTQNQAHHTHTHTHIRARDEVQIKAQNSIVYFPQPSSFSLIPWRASPIGRILCTLHTDRNVVARLCVCVYNTTIRKTIHAEKLAGIQC